MPAGCVTAKTSLIASLTARFDSTGPSGILHDMEGFVLANPDLGSFAADPAAPLAAEKTRITTFLTDITTLAPLPTDPIPLGTLTPNSVAATARSTFVTTTRIPEMDTFLLTTPGYYNNRFQISGFRLNQSGRAQEVAYLLTQLSVASLEVIELQADKEFLESLLP